MGKTNEIVTNNIGRVWGMKWKNIYVIALIIFPMLFAGIKGDFKVVENIIYAIKSDVVIEEVTKEKEDTIMRKQ